MSVKIFLVEGSTGEYSDHIDWPVAAYYNEANAKNRVLQCQGRANALMAEHNDNFWKIPDGANEYDAKMRADYTGVRYSIVETLIEDENPPQH